MYFDHASCTLADTLINNIFTFCCRIQGSVTLILKHMCCCKLVVYKPNLGLGDTAGVHVCFQRCAGKDKHMHVYVSMCPVCVAGKCSKKTQTKASFCCSKSQMLRVELSFGLCYLAPFGCCANTPLCCPTADQLNFHLNNMMHGETSETVSADVCFTSFRLVVT